MRRVRKILQREWECALCAGAALALLLFGLHWLLAGSTEGRRTASGRLTEPPPLLGPRAFAFVEAAEPGPAPARNPFLSSVARRAPPPRPVPPPRRPQPAPPAEPKPAPPPPATPPAVPPTAPAVAVPTPPPAPARRLIACDVRYVFSRVNASGRPMALVEILDPGRPGTAPAVRHVGVDDVVFGMRVQSFTDQSLTLTDASGRRHTVPFGGSSRVVAELEAAP